MRVIAKIARATKFGSTGQAITTPLNDLWTIRNKSYELRVAPVSENPNMLVVQPENSDFVLPAGRYGLVLKGQAYDFTVAGPLAIRFLSRAHRSGERHFLFRMPENRETMPGSISNGSLSSKSRLGYTVIRT